ncbi:hypothetical protein E1A91_D05G314100v1 [Gossypium mustelinum]|uniref:Uncharacterized protein n=1 Tax=Gossypium mustelinum TaxID=34275 RepID=A0A5D2V3A6_GOSMU|nr:hypothetical protein E1A91_D05G314100v1 [Gossypium mustelinum]
MAKAHLPTIIDRKVFAIVVKYLQKKKESRRQSREQKRNKNKYYSLAIKATAITEPYMTSFWV